MPVTVHETQIRVRYKETDGQRRVHHSNFLTSFEVGRTEMLRSRGATYRDFEDAGLFLVVSEASCRYMQPADYDDLLTIRTTLEAVGGGEHHPRLRGDPRRSDHRQRQDRRCLYRRRGACEATPGLAPRLMPWR
jgi:YbgC/YbaW family acyl-CoA thioester hydrolase